LASHFGNPLLEQRKLLSGEAFVHRSDQVVLEVSGPDAKSWLHSLLSQDIINLADGESTEALLLSPQGHIEQHLKLIAQESSLLVIINRERAASFLAWLEKMRFRSKVSVVQTDLQVYGTFSETEGTKWVDTFSTNSSNSASYNPNRLDFHYREIISHSPPEMEEAGLLALNALRIAAGRPEVSDVDEKSLPHEFDWLNSAVHLSKGCYRGQESVAKIHNLGHPPRRLVILNFVNGDDSASRDHEVFFGDKSVGKVLISGIHFEMGSIALALVNRNAPYLDLAVSIGGRKCLATQIVLVPADAGKAANLPRPSAFKLTGRRK
jgi:folate-binding protein YgfZ